MITEVQTFKHGAYWVAILVAGKNTIDTMYFKSQHRAELAGEELAAKYDVSVTHFDEDE